MSGSSSACASMSMEGRAAWIMATAPVPRRTVLGSKVLASAIHTVPVLAIALVVTAATGSLSPAFAAVTLLLGTAAHFFTACLGLMLDTARPRFSWIKPADAVKRGRPSIVAAFLALAIAFGGGAATVAVMLSVGELAALGCMMAAAAVLALLAWACFYRAQKYPSYIA